MTVTSEAELESSNAKARRHRRGILNALRLLCPDGVFEIRCLNTSKGTISGFFDDHEKAAIAVAGLNGHVPAIYVTLNPVNSSLLARSANRLTPYAKCATSEKDIIRRRWLPLDFDAVRPAGISSTDIEHQLAIDRAIEAHAWLTSIGFPAGILASSGNGAHLIHKIAAPNDKDAGDLIQTARIRYAQAYPELTPLQVMKAVKAEKYQGGVKITCKDLRDVFGTVVMDNVKNPDIARRLMRHTSLQTTTKYMRFVKDRMQNAVKFLGQNLETNLGDQSWAKKDKNDFLTKLAIDAIKRRINERKVGGGGRSRTYDAADMSRVL